MCHVLIYVLSDSFEYLYEYLIAYIFSCSTKSRQEKQTTSGFPDVGGMQARLDLAHHGCRHQRCWIRRGIHRWFVLETSARIAVGTVNLNRGQYPAFEAHQSTGIGLGRIPTHHEVGTLPTIGTLGARWLLKRCAVIHGEWKLPRSLISLATVSTQTAGWC